MALLPLNLDYTDKDHAALRVRLFNLISSVFSDWTDREVANFGNILIEMFAFVGDVLLFYQDNQAKESRLSDAVLRKNVLALAKMLNYVPEGNAAATVNVLVTLSEVPTVAVPLAAGRIYETKEVANRLQFKQLFDQTITAGQDPPQTFVVVEHSQDTSDTFQSTGVASQEVQLPSTPYIDASEVVTANNGGFTQVDNFLSSTAVDRHYTVTVDANGRALIRFGNGVNGEMPTGTITVFYKTGGGSVGNVDAGSVTRIIGTVTDTSGTRVQATATNPEGGVGGADRESTASIKQQAPASTKLTDRTVSQDDYELGAIGVAGVSRALMVTSDRVVGLPENRGLLYIVADGAAPSTETLRATVLNEVTVVRPNTITFQLDVVDALYLTVDITATVYFITGYSDLAKSQTARSISDALEAYFDLVDSDGTPNARVKFGIEYGSDSTLPMSDVFCVVESVAGVRKIGARDVDFALNGGHEDLPLQFAEFPRLGTVTITDGDTGAVVVPSTA
jgi:hypothetical protein